jgi:hypothetical protein
MAGLLANAKDVDLHDENAVVAWLDRQPMHQPLRGSIARILKLARHRRGGDYAPLGGKKASRMRYKPERFF